MDSLITHYSARNIKTRILAALRTAVPWITAQ
jgi:hypothetical protein